LVVRWKLLSLAGLSQIRMAFWCEQQQFADPSRRLMMSWMLETM